MHYSRYFTLCLIIGVGLAIVGAILMSMMHPYATTFVIAGTVFAWVHSAGCLAEVYSLPRLPLLDKIIWTVFLLAAPLLAGIIYFFVRKKYVVEEE